MTDAPIDTGPEGVLADLEIAKILCTTQEAHRKELETVLNSFLVVVDCLEALQKGTAEPSQQTVQRILRLAYNVLQRAGVSPIEAAGRVIDLDESEVVEVRPNDQHSQDTVIEEIVRGYKWRGRLMRRAKVVIAAERRS